MYTIAVWQIDTSQPSARAEVEFRAQWMGFAALALKCPGSGWWNQETPARPARPARPALLISKMAQGLPLPLTASQSWLLKTWCRERQEIQLSSRKEKDAHPPGRADGIETCLSIFIKHPQSPLPWFCIRSVFCKDVMRASSEKARSQRLLGTWEAPTQLGIFQTTDCRSTAKDRHVDVKKQRCHRNTVFWRVFVRRHHLSEQSCPLGRSTQWRAAARGFGGCPTGIAKLATVLDVFFSPS